MTKKMVTIRNTFIAILFIELIIVFLLYLGIKQNILLILSFYVSIKNILIFGAIIYITSVYEKNALSVGEVLNEDTSNAFIFGGVGLIQYDDNRNITWVSDLLLAMNVNIVGVKLLEWQPTLAGLFDDEDIKVIDVKGKKFECYNSSDSKLIYIKDVTQYITLSQDYSDQQMCLGYLTIDNYEETIQNADEPKAVQIQSTCRQVIVNWASENGMIIRRYKSGSYLLFFNERIYKKLVEDKFSILDQFKKELLKLDEVVTLSIGIGRGTRVLGELDQMASQALSLTYSRGGDQVAIKSGKDQVKYYGGTTDTFEKSSKVRSRIIAQTIVGLIKRSSNVFVMGHKNSDLDSLSSSIAITRLVQSFDIPVQIIIDQESLEEKTASVVKTLKNDVKYKGLLVNYSDVLERITKDSLLILVDHHKPNLSISETLLERVSNKVVIDHHRRGEEFIDSPTLTYLEPSASSAVELIIELYDYVTTSIDISELDATIMYAGMLVDTNNFKQRVGVRTFQSAAKLKELSADVIKAYELLEDSFNNTVEINTLTKNAYRFKDDILITYGEEDREHNTVILAKSSNALLNIANITASFTIGRISKTKVAISARSSRNINVQMIMEKLGGGGHFTMAACQIEDTTIEEVKEKLENAINEYLNDRSNEE